VNSLSRSQVVCHYCGQSAFESSYISERWRRIVGLLCHRWFARTRRRGTTERPQAPSLWGRRLQPLFQPLAAFIHLSGFQMGICHDYPQSAGEGRLHHFGFEATSMDILNCSKIQAPKTRKRPVEKEKARLSSWRPPRICEAPSAGSLLIICPNKTCAQVQAGVGGATGLPNFVHMIPWSLVHAAETAMFRV